MFEALMCLGWPVLMAVRLDAHAMLARIGKDLEDLRGKLPGAKGDGE